MLFSVPLLFTFSYLLSFALQGSDLRAQITTFDFILLLIISEATQNAMIGNDYSLTNGFLVIVT